MSKVDALLKPLQLGKATMANRFVMSPLTRCRATADHVPTDSMVKYYSDRASVGLIICEATQIEKGYSSFGYEGGIYGKEQVEGWRKVTDAVHAKGGLIYCQIHNGGRATVPSNLSEGKKIVSATTAGIANHRCPPNFALNNEMQPYPAEVHALTHEEIAYYVKLFAVAAKNAMAAGFDGVEIHGANGYLIDQFLRDSCNTRTDEYGGSIENRSRFLLEVVDAVVAAVGKEHVGLRLSPLNAYNDMSDSNPEALTRYVCGELNKRQIAFLDVMRGDFFSAANGADKWAREAFEGTLFTGMGFEIEEAEKTVADKKADGVCFGTKALANPDLVARAIAGAEMNIPDQTTFYTRDDAGYNDYPTIRSRRQSRIRDELQAEKAEEDSQRKALEEIREAEKANQQ